MVVYVGLCSNVVLCALHFNGIVCTDQMIAKNATKHRKVGEMVEVYEINEDRPGAPLARGAIPPNNHFN